MNGPLSGVVVLDLTQQLAGPGCTMLLGDMGAEVIHVEPPPDQFPASLAAATDSIGRWRAGLVWNRNKSSISVDLSTPEGHEIIQRIIAKADVCVQNYRPGVAQQLGLDYEALKAFKPDIIYCEISSFGAVGSEHHRAGFDIAAQAGGGSMGPGWRDPTLPNPVSLPIGDVTGMCLAALGIVSALLHRDRTGEGQRIETSLVDGVLLQSIARLVSVEATDRDWREATVRGMTEVVRSGGDFATVAALGATGVGGQPTHGSPGLQLSAYYRAYKTSDGFIAIGCLNVGQQRRLNKALDFKDPRFESDIDLASPEATARFQAMVSTAEALFRTKTTAEWLAELDAQQIACAPVLSVLEVLDHPHHEANQMIIRYDDPWLGEVKGLGHLIRFDATPMSVRKAMSPLGWDGDAVLASLGYSDDEVAHLVSAGVVHPSAAPPPGDAHHP